MARALASTGCATGAARLTVRLARDQIDLHAAQRLRYRVFVEELGADGPLVDHAARLEKDAFDPIFHHLLLIDETRDPAAGDHVVGAYRLLPDHLQAAAGGFYCDAEFDLTPLRRSGRRLLELGRSCISPEHRGGIGVLQMWHGLAEYARAHEIELLFGAASFPGIDPATWSQALSCLHHDHLAPAHLRVSSQQRNAFIPLPPEALDRKQAMAQMPPLIRSYLRLGATVGQGVFIDHAFRTTDICIVLDVETVNFPARNLGALVSMPGAGIR